MIQLDLFEKDQVLLLSKELTKIKQQTDNLRRGLFARYNELEKMVLDLQAAVYSAKAG